MNRNDFFKAKVLYNNSEKVEEIKMFWHGLKQKVHEPYQGYLKLPEELRMRLIADIDEVVKFYNEEIERHYQLIDKI